MAESEKQGPLAVGQKFLKYTIREQIGRGGHAWVYHGHDPFLDHDVAIKILHRHGGVTEDMLRRGQAEAKLLFRLKHPNIVEVQDAGISEKGLLYIVMELLRGKSLRDVMGERGPLPLSEALDLFLDITRGVEAAHAFGAIHRDLKPENVFILADGNCKILDFGIAKVVDAAGITTERDVLHGTILYISPEQLEGNRASPRSDLYALGLVFFEALHGRHPLLLKGGNPTVRELSLMQIGFRPPRLDELDATVPRHVGRIIEHLLMKSPKQRMQSTQELRAALTESRRRIDEDAPGARPNVGEGNTLRLPTAQDTERIPFALLPDRMSSVRLPTATERLGVEEAGAPVPVVPVPVAPSQRPVTAPPLTTSTRRSAPPARPGGHELPRKRAARALAAGALVGVGLGAAYFWIHPRPTREVALEPPSASATAFGPERATAGTAPKPSPEMTALPAVASAALDAPPAPALAAVTPAPATSPPLTRTKRTRGNLRSSETSRDGSAGHSADDPKRKVWIE